VFTVKKLKESGNIIWDKNNDKPLCKFENGVFQTNDEELAITLQEMGHEVTGEADAENSNEEMQSDDSIEE
jgi:hypothetical protein